MKNGNSKMLDKAIRMAMKIPSPPKNPYAAFMRPVVIIPDKADDKPVIADAGTIVRFMDQSTLYRDFMSPITRRADEVLVQYGKPDKLKLGWVTNTHPSMVMKPTKGPTFLVSTSSDKELSAWERMRLMVGRTRKTDPTNWIAPWLVTHGQKEPKLLREVTREFGGKPIKDEPFADRCGRLFTLILKIEELDMATAKNSKSSKKSSKKNGKKGAKEQPDESEAPKSKKSKKSKKEKPSKADKKSKSSSKNSDRIGKDHDDLVIKRLIKENPRRAGSAKAKIWDKLKKGMTVGEFVEKGGSRASVGRYIQNGWVKLLGKSSE